MFQETESQAFPPLAASSVDCSMPSIIDLDRGESRRYIAAAIITAIVGLAVAGLGLVAVMAVIRCA